MRINVVGLLLRFVPVQTIAVKLIAYLTRQDDAVIEYLLNKALDLVAKYDKEYMPGTEKREKVFNDLKQRIDNVADYVINLVIEIAVAMLRAGIVNPNVGGKK